MTIQDRAREFFDANPELFVVVELDGGRTESELDFHTRIATSFATLEREAAVREFIEKVMDMKLDLQKAVEPSRLWQYDGQVNAEAFREMFGKNL